MYANLDDNRNSELENKSYDVMKSKSSLISYAYGRYWSR